MVTHLQNHTRAQCDLPLYTANVYGARQHRIHHESLARFLPCHAPRAHILRLAESHNFGPRSCLRLGGEGRAVHFLWR